MSSRSLRKGKERSQAVRSTLHSFDSPGKGVNDRSKGTCRRVETQGHTMQNAVVQGRFAKMAILFRLFF